MTQGAGSSAPIKSTNKMTREEAIQRIKIWHLDDDVMKVLAVVIPELAESEDERIRKRICLCLDECVHSDIISDYERDECLAYIEKQKEQKPAGGSSEKQNSQWSEEDERIWKDIFELCNRFGYGDACRLLKSISRKSWKPSEEQMEALMLAIEGKWEAILPTGYMSRRLEDLYEGLANTFGVECNLEK